MIDTFDLLLIKTKDEFEYWLFYKSDYEQAFIEFMQQDHELELDYSIQSLDLLEKWLLQRFKDLSSALKYDQISLISGASMYVGSCLHELIGGKFTVELSDKDNAYWGIPVVRNENKYEAPLILLTTAIDRRIGNFISSSIASIGNN
jgi:hypothetical protein